MQLVLAGQGLKNGVDFNRKLQTFKYRSEVHLYISPDEKELKQLIGASYALILPCAEEADTDVLHALHANVPLIIAAGNSLSELTDNAALYIDLKNSESLAEQLMLLYKDEKIRSQFIENGKIRAGLISAEHSLNELYNAIVQLVNRQ